MRNTCATSPGGRPGARAAEVRGAEELHARAGATTGDPGDVVDGGVDWRAGLVAGMASQVRNVGHLASDQRLDWSQWRFWLEMTRDVLDWSDCAMLLKTIEKPDWGTFGLVANHTDIKGIKDCVLHLCTYSLVCVNVITSPPFSGAM